MNTRLIVNPTSGPVENPELLTDLAEALQTQGIQAEVCTTTPDEDGEGLAADAAKAGAKLVIVAGGDGTIEAVARGLAHTQTMLGIIPLGTRNNIAASLNIPTDLTQAIQTLAEGEHGRFDMGKANNYYFMEVVGVGLEASLFPCGDEVKEGIKKNYLVALKSIFSGVKTFVQFRPHRLVLRFDGRRMRRLRTLQVNICNSPRYGVEFALAPEAKMNDGKLDVIYIDNPSKWDHLRHFFTAMRGDRLPHERLNTYRASKIEVRSYPPLDVHADGECLGTTPVTVEVIPRALWICVPTPELLAKFADESGSPVLTQ
ncbi:YegS/Rv2252/BmrU family lipid kinase [Leptolyngbya sp. FACHB-17]|uniref:diacylglycerol/lipid kinase family protein n=1 Tax=unclassified Leptolyngbya TaxID=2650499 RepID=UPI001681932B|nr:YegS/Rv2252/BmrU family lipid kinase [Leptolyngbya sp. FACHB-17]MBD2080405.1 YegS/Rv2252/BmrU family lipid kinase [Leptolyngbya sp. FACHB-17]